MQRRISRKFNSYILQCQRCIFLKPCFYSDASGQRSTKPYYISYKSNFVQNPIIAFVNQPLANTKKNYPFGTEIVREISGYRNKENKKLDAILSTISWPTILHWIRYGCNQLHKNCSPCHKDRCERVRCFEQQKDDYITILHPSCASPWIRQRMPYWLTRGKLALCTRGSKTNWSTTLLETGNPS